MDKKKIAVIVVGGVALLYYLTMDSAKPNPYKAKTAYGDAVGGASTFMVPPASNDNSVHYNIKMPDMEAPIINNTLPPLPPPSGFNSSGGSGGSSGGSSKKTQSYYSGGNNYVAPKPNFVDKFVTDVKMKQAMNTPAPLRTEQQKTDLHGGYKPTGLTSGEQVKPKTDLISKPTTNYFAKPLIKTIWSMF